MYDVLKRGTVDAVASVEPFVSRSLDDKSGTAVVYVLTTAPVDTPIVIYVSSTAWANRTPPWSTLFAGPSPTERISPSLI